MSPVRNRSHADRPSFIGSAVLGAVAVLALSASGNAALAQGIGGFDHEGLAKQMLLEHVRPGYAAFSEKAGALQSTMAEACKSRKPDDAARAKAAFRETVLAWSRVEHLNFGPAIDKNRFDRILFFPDRQKIGERQVAKILSSKDPTAISAADLPKKSVAVQGLGALEVVLYGKRSGDLLKDTPEGQFACKYAETIAGNVAEMAKAISEEWSDKGKFAAIWLQTGEQNPLYKADNSPTFEMLKAYRFGINNPRERKMLPALGLKRTGPGGPYAPKSSPPFEISALALSSMIANTEGVLELFEKGGFNERLAQNEPESAKLISEKLRSVIAGMKAVEPAGLAAFNDKAHSEKLAMVREPFMSALIAGGEALAAESGMVIGFTDNDGD